MSQFDIDSEIRAGGVDRTPMSLGMDVFFDSFLDHGSFGLFDSTTSTRYGNRAKQIYGKSNLAGALLGEVSSFYALYGVANAAKLPQGLAAITKLKRVAPLLRQ